MQRCQQTDEWLCVLDASVEVMRKCGGELLEIDPRTGAKHAAQKPTEDGLDLCVMVWKWARATGPLFGTGDGR